MWKLKGKFESSEYRNGKYYVTFQVSDLGDKPILGEDELSLKIDKYHPPKTLSANGYYWKLLNLISEELSKQGTYTSVARIHNVHLRTMWHEIMKYRDGSPITLLIPNTDRAEHDALEDTEDHIMPIPPSILPKDFEPIWVNSKGKEFRWYMELRGCRTFDSKEFTKLTNMAVQDAKGLKIKTLDDYELERLEGYERSMQANR